MKIFQSFLLGFIVTVSLMSLTAEARFHHFHGPLVPADRWHQGYWFHGTYVGRAGWWWIMGPSWYYYDSPAYPYPPDGAEAVYVVQVPNAPPPPPEPAPGSTVKTVPPPASPAVAMTTSNGHENSVAFSYYCEKTKNYYPLIATCTEGWIVTQVKAPN